MTSGLPVELSDHAKHRYRQRITRDFRMSDSKLSAKMLADLHEAKWGENVDVDLELWLMRYKSEHENVVFCLNYRTRSAFIVKKVLARNDANAKIVVVTCLKAVCKVCDEVHGAGQCQKWNPSCYRPANIEPRQKRRDVSRAATQRKQDRRRYRESRSKSEQ